MEICSTQIKLHNNIVRIDLKQRKDKLIIHMIAFIKNKTKETVVEKIIELWLPLFADIFLMNNDGEFANDAL